MHVLLVSLFLLGLAVPIILFIGPLRLSPYRIILILLFVPCMFSWLSGRCGKIRSPDILTAFSAIWGSIALLKAHELDAIEASGILIIETFGSYLVARCYIRSAQDFQRAIWILLIVTIILIPFAFVESLTGRNFLNEALSTVFNMPVTFNKEPRLGLNRALTSFEHPILYGVFCSSVLGLVFYVLGHGRMSAANSVRSGLVVIATFFSLSAGPLVALAGQLGLIGWDKITRRIPHRWAILCGLLLAAYVTVDLLSNRTPFEVFISYLTFNEANSYNRVQIWQYGIAEVARHPVFGIGLNEWARAYWMSDSMDNFWLFNAVHYGVPGFGFLAAALIALCASVARLRIRDNQFQTYRKGWFVTVIGLAIAGTTVHYWNAVYCLFMFLIGSGVWMLDCKSAISRSPGRTIT